MMRRWLMILGVIIMAQPVLVRYTLGTKTVEIPAHYAGGLEGSFVPGVEKGAIRLTCHEPLWKDVHDTAIAWTVTQSLTMSMILGRIDGVWDALNNPGNSSVLSIAVGQDRLIYVAGDFLNWASIANADYIAVYDRNADTWSALGTGANDVINTMVVGSDGTLYVGGNFSSIGGVAATGVASWDGSTWTALSTGTTDGAIYGLAFDSSGNLYAGGWFNTIDGVSAPAGVAKWDGSTWTAVGSYNSVTSVNAVAVDSADKVYVGGTFSQIDTTSANNVAYWDGSAWNALGSGTNGRVNAITITTDDKVWVGGLFSTAGGSTANLLAMWNGAAWQGAGAALTGSSVQALMIPPGTNELYVSGMFSKAGNLSVADNLAIWNGTSWSQLDVDLPGTPTVYALAWDHGDLYLGTDVSGTATVSGTNTSVTNNGSAPVYPTIKIKRSGGTSATLETIRNEDSGLALLFNLSILDGETIIIDTGNKTVTSNYRGDLIDKMLPNSDFTDWSLLPGTNDLYVHISTAGSPTITATMQWRECFWSVDDA